MDPCTEDSLDNILLKACSDDFKGIYGGKIMTAAGFPWYSSAVCLCVARRGIDESDAVRRLGSDCTVGRELQADMEKHGIELDVRSYTAIIGAAALAGRLDRAQSIFDQMIGACKCPMLSPKRILLSKLSSSCSSELLSL